ncbi:MAG: hypothetical protein AAB593_01055, partial [Patescibacteria group bacterium]
MRKVLILAIAIFIVFNPAHAQAGVFDNLKNEFQENFFIIIKRAFVSFPNQVKKEAKKQINDVKTVINKNNKLTEIFIAKSVDAIIDNNKNIQLSYQKTRAGFLDNFFIIKEIVKPIDKIKSRVRNIFTINNKQEKINEEQKFQANIVNVIKAQENNNQKEINQTVIEREVLPKQDQQRIANNEQSIRSLIEQINDLKKKQSEIISASSFPVNEGVIEKNEIDKKFTALEQELKNQIRLSANATTNQVIQVMAPIGNNEGSYKLNIQNSLVNQGSLTQDGAATFNAQATFNGAVSINGALTSLNGITITGIINGNITDNITNAFDIQQGNNNYININTTDLLEEIQFGNTTTNPNYTFLGSGALFINASLSTSIIPTTDSSIDLGSNAKQFNNIYARNVNTSGISSSNQAVFTYNPLTEIIANSSVLINPTTAETNEALLGIAIAGIEKFRVDSEGDIITTGDIAVKGGDITSTSALTITPLAGSNFNIALSATGDFAVNTNQLYVDTSAGNIGIGTTAPTA